MTTGIARISSRVHGALIGLVGAGLAVALFHLDGRGVSLLGALSLPLPHLALPTLPGMDQLSRMVQLALVVAMVCIMQTAAVASTFPSDQGNVTQSEPPHHRSVSNKLTAYESKVVDQYRMFG